MQNRIKSLSVVTVNQDLKRTAASPGLLSSHTMQCCYREARLLDVCAHNQMIANSVEFTSTDILLLQVDEEAVSSVVSRLRRLLHETQWKDVKGRSAATSKYEWRSRSAATSKCYGKKPPSRTGQAAATEELNYHTAVICDKEKSRSSRGPCRRQGPDM